MSRLQLNFNGGEIDEDERERVDLKLYDTGLALGLNVISRPHGGLSGRPGLSYFARLKRQISAMTLSAEDFTLANGGTAADLASGEAFETSTETADAAAYIVAEIDFGAPVSVAAIDLSDYYFDDGSEGAGDLPPGNGTPGGGTSPEEELPGRPVYDGGGSYIEP